MRCLLVVDLMPICLLDLWKRSSVENLPLLLSLKCFSFLLLLQHWRQSVQPVIKLIPINHRRRFLCDLWEISHSNFFPRFYCYCNLHTECTGWLLQIISYYCCPPADTSLAPGMRSSLQECAISIALMMFGLILERFMTQLRGVVASADKLKCDNPKEARKPAKFSWWVL